MIIAYHRASGLHRSSNSVAMLNAHFAHIAKNYSVVMPGEETAINRLSLCLTFDDAYCDFYHLIYPLLKKHQLRALLAVPTGFIQQSTTVLLEERLERLQKFWCFNKERPSNDIFCTFDELREMQDCVAFASHTHTHPDLSKCNDISRELSLSKEILEKELGPVNTLIYPYGRVSRKTSSVVSKIYTYQMRLGSALNWGWSENMLYRITGDSLLTPNEIFTKKALVPPLLKLASKKVLPLFRR